MDIQRPEIDFPGGEPSAELQITDIWEGDGGEAKPGDTVKVHYVGVAYSTGEEFDASWNRGEPLEFKLGAGRDPHLRLRPGFGLRDYGGGVAAC
jgi:peptidylprolyl isomerase